MEIGSSLSIYSGLGSLFEQGKSRNKQADEFGGSTRSQSGAGLQPSTTPPSIANTMWAVQAGNETYINQPSEDEMATKAAHSSLVDEFSDWSNMDPAEFIRARYLEAHGLTEDDLKAMPADQREAIEKEIAEQIKRELAGIEGGGDGAEQPSTSGQSSATQPADETPAES
ncbi:hypothetical protein FHX08_002419 [Rhizobium sp. BK529]|uniref:hypothetical protein n=1 Tax=unclassified Rhizobium TaxID=2613769 RepID=UPI0010435D8C|nr:MULTISPECIES: hypothetical protein [unclassified Rhizobium]MBB3592075.1 hypothetical protein [Rhizobium sp. BK529]